jgi:hypothetical protein
MDDSFSRALARLKGFSGFRSDIVRGREDLDGAGVDLRLFEAILTSGGDERIATDPATGRNRYGVPPGRASDEVWFSSSTATAISPRGYDAALLAFQGLAAGDKDSSVSAWFDRIRSRLLALFGVPGAGAILCASGTEAELIVRVIAANLLAAPLTSVVVAPTETGSGVPLAAEGRHFLATAPFADQVPRGQLLDGLSAVDTEVVAVAIRGPAGEALSIDAIDDEVVAGVEAAMSRGRSALVHVLGCSKTNRFGPRRETALALQAKYGDRVLVAVDSCQLRCPPEQIRTDLDSGFIVMVTGSKFAGGPPFAGAVLLPPAIVDRMRLLALPPGIFAYSAAADWPAVLRGALNVRFAMPANVGLGLRWEAALAELEALFALDRALRERVAARFATLVREVVGSCASFELLDEDLLDQTGRQTIFPIVTLPTSGAVVPAEVLHRALRSPLHSDPADPRGRAYHVGQPVVVGQRSALRVCLSAPHVVAVGERVGEGRDFDEAFAPLAADLNALFLKWLSINSRHDRASDALLTA